MTTLQKINNLTWHNAIGKLKEILKELLTLATPTAEKIEYKALLNKTNFTNVTATELVNTLPDNITIQYNQSITGGSFFTDVLITHLASDNLLIPLYYFEGENFDANIMMSKFLQSSTQTVIRFQFSLEDFQNLEEFPFNFEVFR